MMVMELALHSPVQYVLRVGPKMAKKLEKLGIKTVEDLLYYAPFRYNDFSLISPIARVQPGETVTVSGMVGSIHNVLTKNGKRIQQAVVSDETGSIEAVWFNQPFLVRTIAAGDTVFLAGKVGWFGHKVVMESPEYEISSRQSSAISYQPKTNALIHTGRLVPVYSETAGVTSKWLRGRIAYVLQHCKTKVLEYLPDSIKEKYSLVEIQNAIEHIHFPLNQETAKESRRRLAFDELFLIQLRAYRERRLWQTTQTAQPFDLDSSEVDSITKSLPFTLTGDQKQAIREILADLQKPVPMNHLLLGDVGAGKTVVAAIAIYIAHRNGFQSVLMAPTQILAEQHYQTISDLLTPFDVKIQLITGAHKNKKEIRGRARNDNSPEPKFNVVVGTHALLSESVNFENVGLVVIDEQQRFGVAQRTLLWKKGQKKTVPHLLTMTATPIPRTVARTLYGNLDISVLSEMPLGRKIVKTWVVPKEKRERAYAWIRRQIRETGGQAFIVCPLIEESESLATVKSVKAEHARLKTIFSEFSLGLLHGRMKAKEKSEALERFCTRKDAILLATPVVEVGIDVPNAIIIVVEAAERFGLAQLHQLRGRVGRGRIASFCLLFTEQETEAILARLKALERVHNGPELAELDLKLRGPGELFGTRQHGIPNLKIASLSDTELIHQTQEAVKELTEQDPNLTSFAPLREKMKGSTIETAIQD